MFFYEANIIVASIPYDTDDSGTYDSAFFSNPQAAEAWIAQQQAKIASEEMWTSNADGSSSVTFSDREYFASISKVQAHDSLESWQAERDARLAQLKAKLFK